MSVLELEVVRFDTATEKTRTVHDMTEGMTGWELDQSFSSS